jgi:hypothetical protein
MIVIHLIQSSLGSNGVVDEVVVSAADEKVEVYMNKKNC